MNNEKKLFDIAFWLLSLTALAVMLTSSLNKRQAGSIGGRATFSKHGREHMRTIGKRGAVVTWTRYTLKPVNESQYAMVNRETNIIKAVIGVWK